jgi:citrate synthase
MTRAVETAISQVFPDRILVRGYNLVELAQRNHSFGDVVYLLLRGELPAQQEGRLVEAMLVVMAEHSINSPSTHAARTVASCGSPVQAAMAAGLNAIGELHGGAGEACARLLQEALAHAPEDADLHDLARRIIQDVRTRGERLPGFGHYLHNPDPRTVYLLQLAKALGLAGRHVALAEALAAAFLAATGRSLPLNVDGALAAIISDLGFDWRLGKGLFIIARTAGLLAHVHEEMVEGKPFGPLTQVEANYTGMAEREI